MRGGFNPREVKLKWTSEMNMLGGGGYPHASQMDEPDWGGGQLDGGQMEGDQAGGSGQMGDQRVRPDGNRAS